MTDITFSSFAIRTAWFDLDILIGLFNNEVEKNIVVEELNYR